MATVTIHQAKTQLSKLIARAEAGEEIVIARGKEPVVKLTPVADAGATSQVRCDEGKVARHPGFVLVRPLPEEELKLWEGGDEDPSR